MNKSHMKFYNLLYFCILIIVISSFYHDFTYAMPIQVLKNKPGWIAVYIRHGNEPLADINPALAEAFHEKNVPNEVVPVEKDNSLVMKDTVGRHKPQNSLNSSDKKDVTAEPYMVLQSS